MDGQLTIGEALAQIGMDQAANAASTDFLECAQKTLLSLVEARRPFTAEDVLVVCEEVGAVTPEPRALGAVIKQASQNKLIRPTGRWVKSTRAKSHARPMCEWIAA